MNVLLVIEAVAETHTLESVTDGDGEQNKESQATRNYDEMNVLTHYKEHMQSEEDRISERLSQYRIAKDEKETKKRTEMAAEQTAIMERTKIELLKKQAEEIQKRKKNEIEKIKAWKDEEIRKLKDQRRSKVDEFKFDTATLSTRSRMIQRSRNENSQLRADILTLQAQRDELLTTIEMQKSAYRKCSMAWDSIKDNLLLETKLQHSKESLKAEIKESAIKYRLKFEDCRRESNARNILSKYIRAILCLLEENYPDKRLVYSLWSLANNRKNCSLRNRTVAFTSENFRSNSQRSSLCRSKSERNFGVGGINDKRIALTRSSSERGALGRNSSEPSGLDFSLKKKSQKKTEKKSGKKSKKGNKGAGKDVGLADEFSISSYGECSSIPLQDKGSRPKLSPSRVPKTSSAFIDVPLRRTEIPHAA